MTRKKVLITTGIYPPDIGGPATYSKILVSELPKRGIETELLNFSPLKRWPRGIRHLIYFLRILRLGRNVDMIYAQDPVTVGLPSAVASIFLRKPLFLKIVGDYAWEQGMQRFGVDDLLDVFQNKRYGWQVEILRNIEHWVVGVAKNIIVPSEYLKGIVSQWDGDNSNVSVVYNAVDIPLSKKTRVQAREELGLEGTIAVSIGRLVPWKGFSALIEIVSTLVDRIPDLKLIIIGEGGERQALEHKIHALSLEDHVLLKGALSKEETFLQLEAADIFILNTGYEGFSHAILEAMAAGTPVITTRVGGNPELIDNHVNGLLVEFNDSKQIHHSIIMLLEDTELTSSIIEKARATANSFNQQCMVEKTITEVFPGLL